MAYSSLILTIAKSVGVPGALLVAICSHESHLKNVMVPHDNGSPSYGLCQIKAETAKALGFNSATNVKYKPSKAFPGAMETVNEPIGLMNPAVNIKYAALYLKMQLDRYDGDLCRAVAAYNSGTYNPSKTSPNIPRNIKYVKYIVLHLSDDQKDMLVCGGRKISE